jgi:tetratricopeptide (TPR) repeat protein
MKFNMNVKSYFSLFLFVIFLGSIAYSQDYLQMGIDKLSKKNYKGAIEDLTKAVEKTPKSSKAYFYLAEGFYLDGQIDKCEINLRKAVDYDDENAQAFKRLGDVYFKKGVFRDALVQYNCAIKLEKRNPDFLLALGKTLVAIDSIDKAVNVLSQADDIDPNNTEIKMSLGDAYFKMGVPAMALDKYKDATRIDSNNSEAHFKLGDIYMNKMKMPREAINEYIKGITIDSTNPAVLFKVSHLLYYNATLRVVPYERVVYYYKKYVDLIDTSYQAYWEYGTSLIYVQPSQFEESIKNLKKAVALNKQPVEALRSLSLANFYSQNFKNAIKSYNELIKFDSLSIDEHLNLARSYYFSKDTSNAINEYLKVIELNPYYDKIDVYGALENIYYKKGMFKEAAGLYIKRAEIDTTDAKILYYSKAGSYFSAAQELENAKSVFAKVLEMKPDEASVHYYLGTIYQQYKSDSIKQAVDEFKEFLNLMNGKDYDKKTQAQVGNAYFVIGIYEFSNTKNYARALENFDKCLKYDEKNEYALFYRVHCFLQLDQKDEACEAVKRLLKYYPKHKEGLKFQKERCWFR